MTALAWAPPLIATAALALAQVATTSNDLFQPGSQPGSLNTSLLQSQACSFCHGGFDESAPFDGWQASMMANSQRDPIFHAALSIANQDAAGGGEFCMRCHTPGGFLEGHTTPPDGSALTTEDFDGVSCQVCHRMVDPIADPSNPSIDGPILAGLPAIPSGGHGGQYVVDPDDQRRGPFDPEFCNLYHPGTVQSTYHQDSALCGTCHEVSNPMYTRVGGPIPASGDSYILGPLDAPHPTHIQYDQFPVERTYSEWLMSDFGQGPVDMGGLFGGNKTEVSTCQDCHLPDATGTGCAPFFGSPVREDLPRHTFAGANSWVPLAIAELDQTGALYDATKASGVPASAFQGTIDLNTDMLRKASDLDLTQLGDALQVRVTNNGGHKLPTGYPEGRRMWIGVQFLDAAGTVIHEHGAYDPVTATLNESDTKVYEKKIGLDAAAAALTSIPEGPSFHFILNNKVYKDNRIPPRGFNNANFESVQAGPVAYSYADGQFWDDTLYDIPVGAATARVGVYHQTTTKEYIEFLRNENLTDGKGQLAYDLWEQFGKSAPVEMDLGEIVLSPRLTPDVESISTATGGTQNLSVEAGPDFGNQLYWIVGTLSGTSPGLPISGFLLPLNPDPYFQATISAPQSGLVSNALGFLDPNGRATASLTLPANPAWSGLHLDHAYGVISLTGLPLAVSSPAGLDLIP